MDETIRESRGRLITVNGRTQSISDWARESGISRQVIWRRLSYGWSPELAVTQPKLAKQRTKHGTEDW